MIGDGDSIAVFIDRASQKTIRLRPGEAHAGWVLSSVLRREVTLKKDDRTETIGLKAMEGPAAPAQPPSAIGAARQQDVVDVAVVLAIRWNDRTAQRTLPLERFKHRVVAIPDRQPLARDVFGLLELSPQERRDQIARQER